MTLLNSRQRAFTLVELVIVAGIVLILAGISIEQFAAASVRAKVARAKSELRTIAAAIDLYAADFNQPPRMRSWEFYADPALDIQQTQELNGNLSPVLTTPIAYLPTVDYIDPFMFGSTVLPLTERMYTYQDIGAHLQYEPNSKFWPLAKEFYGPWRIASIGPDQAFAHGFVNSGQLPYDPTNGTSSQGNLWYAPKYKFDGMPNIPEMLGPH